MNTALVGGSLYDGDRSELQVGMTVVINGDRIVAVESAAETVFPDDAIEVDVTGQTILPGLIDLHSHCTWQYHFNGPGRRSFRSPHSDMHLALAAIPRLQQALSAGQTTMRDCGSIGDTAFELRSAIEVGYILGPRLHVAGQIVEPVNGPHPHEPRTICAANGEEAVRRAVWKQIDRGADFVKVAINDTEWTQGELRAAVEEAHQSDRKVACHVFRPSSTKLAISAGVDSLEHARFLDAEDVRAMADTGIAWVAAVSGIRDKLPLGEAFLRRPSLAPALRAEVRATLDASRPIVEAQRDTVERALDAGVMIGAGTDRTGAYGPDPFADLARELEVLVDLGMPTHDALSAATGTAAAISGEADVGVVAPGRLADLIVVDGNPLGDIRSVANVVSVIKGGVFVSSAEDQAP